MKKTMVVLISGRIGSGKSTLASFMNEYFVAEGYNSKVFNFAYSLKLIAKKVFGWDGEKDEKGRVFLQNLGKSVRGLNPDYWVQNTQMVIENDKKYPFDVIIIDDWRYANEVDVLAKDPINIVYKLRVACEEEKTDKHESENSLPDDNSTGYYFRFETIPYGTDYLEACAELFCADLLEEHLKGE